MQTKSQLLQELIDQHPDVVAHAATDQILNYLSYAPFLAGVSGLTQCPIVQVVKAKLCFDFQWGQEFKITNKREPLPADWGASFYDRANAFCDRLGILKAFDKPDNRMRLEFGGPF